MQAVREATPVPGETPQTGGGSSVAREETSVAAEAIVAGLQSQVDTLEEELLAKQAIISALEMRIREQQSRIEELENVWGEEASVLPSEEAAPAPEDTARTPPNVELNYSWNLQPTYTSVPIYVTNHSNYSVDVVLRIKTFDGEGVTIYDDSLTLRDIWPGETFYEPGNATGARTASVVVRIADASATEVPPVSRRTDLVIIDDMPVRTAPNSSPSVRIRNTTNQTLAATVRLRRYDSEGYLRETSHTSYVGTIDPFETRLCRMGWTGGTPMPQEYFIYLVDK